MDAVRKRVFELTADLDLPLARGGAPVRTALREAADEARETLVRSWFEALADLHRGGFGTDDAVVSARVSARGRVRIDPDRIWPLGARVARRPIAAWLDRQEALAWLESAGAANALVELARALCGPAPWPGWPGPVDLSAAHPAVMVGPPAEVEALAVVAGVSCLPAVAFTSSASVPALRRQAEEAVTSGRPFIVPLADPADLRLLALYPGYLARLPHPGGAPPLGEADYETFGIDPAHALPLPPTSDSADMATATDLSRDLENARLHDPPESRARAEAAALYRAGQRAHTPEDAERLLSRVIDLARETKDRPLVVDALVARATARLWDERERAHTDLVEARRLARASGLEARATTIAELDDALLATTTGPYQSLPVSVSEAAPPLLTRALCAPPLEAAACVGLAVDRLATQAIVDGTEEACERVLRRLSHVALPPVLAPFVSAWTTYLAARRDAVITAREALVAAAHRAQTSTRTTTWDRRAAALEALAAGLVELDGLGVSALERAPKDDPLARLARGEDVLQPGAPDHLILLTLERAGRSDGDARRAADLLAARFRGDDDALPSAVALALGLFRHDRALLSRASQGEPHIERRALVQLLASADPRSEEGQALARRHAALGLKDLASTKTPPAHTSPPFSPPFTPEDAQGQTLALVARAAHAATGRDVDGWGKAIAALIGPIAEGRLPATAAAFGLRLVERHGDRWRLVAGDDQALFSLGPIAGPPAVVAGALEALAPLFVAAADAAPGLEPDPRVLDQGLVDGSRSFFDDIATPFKRRELTRKIVRGLVHLGLTSTHGLYRSLAERWNVADYQRFMDFLRRGDLLLDYRVYRRGGPPPPPP